VPANYPSNGPALPAGVVKNSNNSVYPAMPRDNFAPRIGISWQPTASNRLVVHAGGGFFYDQMPGNAFVQSATQSAPYSYTLADNAFITSLATPWDPTLPGWNSPRYANFTESNGSYPTSLIDQPITTPWLANPLLYLWNLNVEYEVMIN
jgi:hypothetical protein